MIIIADNIEFVKTFFKKFRNFFVLFFRIQPNVFYYPKLKSFTVCLNRHINSVEPFKSLPGVVNNKALAAAVRINGNNLCAYGVLFQYRPRNGNRIPRNKLISAAPILRVAANMITAYAFKAIVAHIKLADIFSTTVIKPAPYSQAGNNKNCTGAYDSFEKYFAVVHRYPPL